MKDGKTLYQERLPIKPLDISTSDNNLEIRLTGFSGDFVRTCVYYEIEDNPLDFQVQEAFLMDDKERAYCLISVERKGEGAYSTWMEFGPVPPDTMEIELHILRLQQAPTMKDFKMKGRTFIDPWDPELPLTNELIDKMDKWLGDTQVDEEIPASDWMRTGEWSFLIPMGEWHEEEVDFISPLDFNLTLGSEKAIFREFRNSNSGSFIVYEVRDKYIQKMGGNYKVKLLEEFATSDTAEEFMQKIGEEEMNLGYTPVNLNLRLRDPVKDIFYSPDFIEARGVVQNRIYNFFDDCICADKLEIHIKEILNLKLDKPLECDIDIQLFSTEKTIKIDRNFGDIRVRGELIFLDMIFSEENMRISYTTNKEEGLERIALRDVSLIVKEEDGTFEEYPTLGGVIRYDMRKDKFKKIITFPAIHRIKGTTPKDLTLVIKSINVKLCEPIIHEFNT